jgi:hypothetical protein
MYNLNERKALERPLHLYEDIKHDRRKTSKMCHCYTEEMFQEKSDYRHRLRQKYLISIFLATEHRCDHCLHHYKMAEINFFQVFEVLTAVVMKDSVFWDMTPYSPLKVNRRLGGTCRLLLQGRSITQARKPESKQVESRALNLATSM